MEAKRHTLANALRAAATQYVHDAASVEDARLSRQFAMQASEANRLADAIEQADTIRLTD